MPTSNHRFAVLLLLLLPAGTLAQTAGADELLSRALRLADLYNWSDAQPLFEQAEREFTRLRDSRNALYAKLGRVRSTMEQISLPEASEMLSTELDDNPILQTDKHLRMFCLAVKGDIDGEMDSAPMRRDWEAVLGIARELGDKKWENRASGELGFAAFLDGDLARAQQMVAGALVAATLSQDMGAQIRYQAAIGTAFALTGSFEQALSYLDRAAAVAQRNPDSGYQFVIHTGRLTALRGLQRFDAAEKLTDEMLAEARARKKYIKEAQVLISSSGTSVARKQYSQAIERLQAAVALTTARQVNRLLADAQFELASVYRTTGDLKRAEQMAAAATSASQNSGEIYELPKRLLYLAQIQASLAKYSEADAAYDRAADFVETMVGSVSRVATKAALISATSEIFTEHFSLLANDLKNVSKAYEVVERARGRAATDLLRTGARPSAAYDRQVDRQIAKLRLDLLDARNSTQVKRIRDRIFLVEQTRWLSPLPTTLSSAPHNTVPLERLQRKLDPQEVLIEYVLAEPRSHCLVITRERARIVALPGRAQIEKIVSSYLEAIKSKRTSTALGQELFAAVLKPVTEIGPKKRISIVRDGQLHLLPFDALIDPTGRYLAETYTITYAPSATTSYLLRTMPAAQVAQRILLGVGGVPYDTASSLTTLATTRGYTTDQLSNLPASGDEILVAANALQNPNNTLLIGQAATETAFKNSRLERYKVIHLAVHGVANSDRPDQAALILLSDAAAGEDGILQASEVLQLRTNADLVVLSACDTAIGRLEGAEGIANLARAFLLSGAHTVVATLWSIDDTFSVNLMKQFYAHLATGKSIATSLSEAKRDTLRTLGSQAVPYYWAGFTLEGIGDRPVIMRSADPGIPSKKD